MMEKKKVKIVVVGSINMDLVVHTPHLPVPGETVLGEDLQTLAGGKGANQAVACARLGADAIMLGCIGEDIFGTQLRENMSEVGVDCSHLYINHEHTTGVALIGIDGGTKDNTIIVAGGANRMLSKRDIRAVETVIAEADVLICQLEIPLPAVEEALFLARKHQVTTILNAAPICDLPQHFLSLIDILIVNRTEAAQLSGMHVEELEDIEQASALLLARGVGSVIVTLGGQGSHHTDETHRSYIPAFPVKAVDTVGAGDAFAGAFAVGYAEGMPMNDLLRFCNACGALATTREGAQNSMPTRDELSSFLAQF